MSKSQMMTLTTQTYHLELTSTHSLVMMLMILCQHQCCSSHNKSVNSGKSMTTKYTFTFLSNCCMFVCSMTQNLNFPIEIGFT